MMKVVKIWNKGQSAVFVSESRWFLIQAVNCTEFYQPVIQKTLEKGLCLSMNCWKWYFKLIPLKESGSYGPVSMLADIIISTPFLLALFSSY